MKILADSAIPYLDYYFAEHGEVTTFSPYELSSAALAETDILLVRSTVKVDQVLLSQAKQLKWVGSCVSGKDHFDESYLLEHKIPYYTAKGCNADAVAEYVLTCTLALQNAAKLPQHGRAAVIGVGEVGSRVAKLLTQLGFAVLTCDPFQDGREGFVHTPLVDIDNVDLICVHAELTKSGPYPSVNLLSKDFFTQQQAGCVLINAARGEVIDENALFEYGQHLTWCLDVYPDEPQIRRDIIEQAYIATPHIAGHTVEAKVRGIAWVYQAAAASFGWGQKPMPTETITWSAPKATWQQQVLAYSNPHSESERFKLALSANDDSAKVFSELRKAYIRHEFHYVSDLQAIKHKLGYSL